MRQPMRQWRPHADVHRDVIDKNSLWGKFNIQKKQWCVKGICRKILCLFGGLFSKDSGDYRSRAGEGRFQPLGEARQAFLRLIGARLKKEIAGSCRIWYYIVTPKGLEKGVKL